MHHAWRRSPPVLRPRLSHCSVCLAPLPASFCVPAVSPGLLVRVRWRSEAAGAASPSLPRLKAFLENKGKRRFFFIGGKGGVGKTTTAAALAIYLAKTGQKTLVVSTDPAHSLGDALAMGLTGEPQRVIMDGIEGCAGTTCGSLHALEISPAIVLDQFRKNMNLEQLRKALDEQRAGLGVGFLAALAQAGVDLDALGSLLDFSPPGIDEAVALGHLVHLLHAGEHSHFDQIVIDTAPTGHTLRLLAFPQFLHGLIATVLSVHEKISAGFSPMGRLLGSIVGEDLHQQLKVTKANLENIMVSMNALAAVLEDADATSFIVVTIPTHLAVTESIRLLEALVQAQMPARHLIINQCPVIASSGAQSGSTSVDMLREAESAAAKLRTKHEVSGLSENEAVALCQMIERMQHQYKEAERQIRMLEDKVGDQVQLLRTPMFDEQLTGVVALDRYADILLTDD